MPPISFLSIMTLTIEVNLTFRDDTPGVLSNRFLPIDSNLKQEKENHRDSLFLVVMKAN